MILLTSFDTSKDFFEQNPQIKFLFKNPPTSKIMWALFLLYHPSSVFSEETFDDRLSLIRNDFLDDPSFDPTEYESITNTIMEHTTSRMERLLKSWEKKLDERNALMEEISYDIDTFEQVDKLMKTYPDLWKGFEETKKKLLQEDKGKTKGDIRTSLTEDQKI